jgi:hypothetical protein
MKALFENEERQKEAVTTAVHTTVPYKVLMSLLDKEEIGSAIIDDVLIYVLQHLHAHRDSPSSHDIIKTAILLFDQLQLHMFWSYLTSLITDEFSRVTNNSTLEVTLPTHTWFFLQFTLLRQSNRNQTHCGYCCIISEFDFDNSPNNSL